MIGYVFLLYLFCAVKPHQKFGCNILSFALHKYSGLAVLSGAGLSGSPLYKSCKPVICLLVTYIRACRDASMIDRDSVTTWQPKPFPVQSSPDRQSCTPVLFPLSYRTPKGELTCLEPLEARKTDFAWRRRWPAPGGGMWFSWRRRRRKNRRPVKWHSWDSTSFCKIDH